jgi:hypothetical protein
MIFCGPRPLSPNRNPLSASALVLAAAHTRRLTLKVAACTTTSAFVSHWRLADDLDPDAAAFLASSLPVDEPVACAYPGWQIGSPLVKATAPQSAPSLP